MKTDFIHNYDFDPTYGYGLQELLKVSSPNEPRKYKNFWKQLYQETVDFPVDFSIEYLEEREKCQVYFLDYQSTHGVRIRGWLTTPKDRAVEKALIISHGYGGRHEPDFHLPFEDSALFFPCSRGLGRSHHYPISPEPKWHVRHNIHDRREYIIGHCVQDLWVAVSIAEKLFPQVRGRVGLMGISFGGGIGVMASAWDSRIKKAHFNIPTFGNQTLRLELPSFGSAKSLQDLHKREPRMVEKTLAYFDAATSAKYIQIPVHFACALFDPYVAPPGQFAIYNALTENKELFVLSAGHFDYDDKEKEQRQLLLELKDFFKDL
ncbi:hypothetical protein LNTAR_05346 [Lentisphaera araneosa HTCC2155]|uniref:Acetyl xylan esterase domain-containing protein n=1 Tax=Lentisphaera araneosa HTCC2155 TaxID=313628 RepID=A6DLQ6_9BACT|nr:acetylxylan esterase [Lentisphaera araneosa]EDM27511.1 hypothetical protein LNTAR_05346 [Lentisphaera araneosa HTCC2155]